MAGVLRVPVRRRKTWQRDAILKAMAAMDCHVTAEALHRRLRRGSRPIGLATVYRALERFVRDGQVEPVHIGDGPVRYGLTSRHHDHLVCLNCGDWEPIEPCLIPKPPRHAPSGFRITGHQLELYGYCVRCRDRSPGDR